MLSLQQLAVYNLAYHTTYDGSDQVVENVIFEVDQLRHKLAEDINAHRLTRPVTPRIKYDLSNYNKCVELIGDALFDGFTYTDNILTDAHVEWKEYFHTLYHFAVINDSDEITLLGSTADIYTKVKHPKMVDMYDVNYHTINYINNLFKSLHEEHDILANNITIRGYHDDHLQYGRELFEWIKHRRQLLETLEKYEDIINWSMH